MSARKPRSKRREILSRSRRLMVEPLEDRQLLATFTVDTLLDNNDGDISAGEFSLREAIQNANDGDVVDFQAGLTGTIVLGGTQLSIADDISIEGPGASVITVSANNASRVFFISSNVSISGLTITGGNVGGGENGGGILVGGSGDLTLDRVLLHGNAADNQGGGVCTDPGRLTVLNSTIANNTAQDGAGLAHNGLLPNDPNNPTLLVINSTISGNQAVQFGGGALVGGGAGQFRNSTITGNRAMDPVIGNGGGIFTFDNVIVSTTLYNTIVASNLRGVAAGTASDLAGKNVETASANNLIGNAATAGGLTNNNNGNIVGNDGTGTINITKVLEPVLSDNGGPTRTHALVTGSRALDAGNNALALDPEGAALTTDQRGAGFARIVDGPDADATATVDIGAYEASPRTLVVDSLASGSDGNYGFQKLSLREAIERTNANAGLDTINFDSRFVGGSQQDLNLNGTELSIRDSVSINGPGARYLNVNAGFGSRVFNIGVDANLNPVSVSIADLGIINGAVTGAGGAGILAQFIQTRLTLARVQMSVNVNHDSSGGAIAIGMGYLTIVDSAILNNSANVGGAIFYNGTGPLDPANPTLLVINSTISGNQAEADAGGVYVSSRSAEFRNSTITGNRADSDGMSGGNFGGIFNADGFASTTLKNTIVAGNLRGSGAGMPSDLAGTMEGSSANNLIGDAATAGGLMDDVNGNIVGNDGAGTIDINTVLDELNNYGGPTLTHLLVPNSPAIDAGNNALARNQNGGVLAADQRGLPRIKDYNASGGPKVDIGAVEMQPPVITLGGSITYTENTPARILASAAAFDGMDTLPSFEMGTLRVTSVVAPHAADRLAVRNQGTGPGQIGVSGSTITFEGFTIGTFTGGAGATPLVIALNAEARDESVQALLRNITFQSLSENPPTTARSIRFRMTDGAGAVSNVATKTVNIAAVNDAPVLAPADGGTVGYQQNTAPIALLSNATVTDPDSANFAGGRLLVRIISGGNASNRLLVAGAFELDGDQVKRTSDGLVIGTRNTAGGAGTTRLEITFNANARRAIVQQLVRGIRFRTVNGTSTVQRVIEFSVTDGDGGASNKVTKTVNVT